MKPKKKRKEEIIDAGTNLFREKGYASATMRDLADRVGIEVSSLYSHISAKEEILIHICNHCAKMYIQGMEEVENQNGSFQEKLISLLKMHLEIAKVYPSSVTVFNDEWRHLPPQELATFLQKRKQYEDSFKNLLKQGMETNEFVEMSVDTAFNIVLNCLKWIHYHVKKIEDHNFDTIVIEVSNFIIRGLFTSKNENS